MASDTVEEVAVSTGAVEQFDALAAAGGFAGVWQLINLREIGLTAKRYDMAGQLGGIWYWHRDPGARVDPETPLYQFSRETELCWDSAKQGYAGLTLA